MKVFEEQIKLEKDVEELRCMLAKRVDFSCLSAWQVFDYRNLGYMNMEEFTHFLFSYIGATHI